MRVRRNLGPKPYIRRYSDNSIKGLCLGVLMTCPGAALAAQWQLHPNLQVEEIYTDNLTLAPPDQNKTDFVTGVNPGFRLTGEGARIKANIAYQLQNYLYANNDQYNNSYNQLNADGSAELLKDIFFIDARSSIDQQIVTPLGPVGVDNVNPTGNFATVSTVGVSPYLKLNMKSYANVLLRYDYDVSDYGSSAVSNAYMQRYAMTVKSGPRFYRLNWNLDYKQSDLIQATAFDAHTKSGLLTVRYGIFRTLNFLSYAGYEDNQVPLSSTIGVPVNGSYWSAGMEWIPSRHITASATAGYNERTADLRLSGERTALHIGYTDLGVGLLIGPAWTVDLSHYTRRTTWQASYSEQRTNLQSLEFLGQIPFEMRDNKGNIVVDPNTGFPVVLAPNVFGLVNDEFLTKRAQGVVSLATAKSTVTLSVFQEWRAYVINPQTYRAAGTGASWNWRLTSRLQADLGANWQTDRQSNPDQSYDLWYGTVGLVRKLSAHTDARLEYSHLESTGMVGTGQYRENRVTLQVNMRY